MKHLDEPVLLREIRDLPRRYLKPGGVLNAPLLRLDLGLGTEEALKDALLALYRLDVAIAHRIDERFVRAILARLVGDPLPTVEVPPDAELAWFAGEAYCASCPGSEERPVYEGGPVLPLCHARERIERWEGCQKFRENLRVAAADAVLRHDESLAFAKANGMVEEFEREADAKIAEMLSTEPIVDAVEGPA